MRPVWLCLSVLVLSVPAEAKKPKPPKADAVQLTFGWKEGWHGEHGYVLTKTTETSGEPTRVETSEAQAELRLAPYGDGLVTRTGPTSLTHEVRVGAEVVPDDPLQTALVQRLSRIPFGVRIGPDGSWRGIDDEAGVTIAFEAAIRETWASARETAPPDRQAAFDAMATPEGARRLVARTFAEQQKDWWAEVSFWPGARLEIGADYVQEGDSTTPTGASLHWTRTFGIAERRPCHDGPGAPTCVVLVLMQRTDPAQLLASTLAELEAQTPGGRAADGTPVLVPDAATHEERWIGLVEPDNLRPWRWIKDTEVTVHGAVAGVETSEKTVEHEVSDYAWR